MRHTRVLVALLAPALACAAGPNVLVNSDHEATQVESSITTLGGTVGSGGSYVDQTCKSGYTITMDDPTMAPYDADGCLYYDTSASDDTEWFYQVSQMAAFAVNTSASLWAAGTSTPIVNHAPYGIISQSSSGYALDSYDQPYYSSLIGEGVQYVMAFCGNGGNAPPTTFAVILPDGSGPTTNGCGYQAGVEFSMSANYEGLCTSTPSCTTASLTGIMTMLKSNNPSWTWGDVKAALRQTASNWATGYTICATSCTASGGSGYGYGDVNYTEAAEVSSASGGACAATGTVTNTICLQPPGMVVDNLNAFLEVTLYPYVQTRRSYELVYSCSSNYDWPVKNEYTASDVSAGCGPTPIYSDQGSGATVPSFYWAPAASGTVTLIAFTTDGDGDYSRVESFSPQSENLVVAAPCTN